MDKIDSKDPYARGLVSGNNYVTKSPVHASVVAVLRGTIQNRGLELIKTPSRAVCHHEVHEIIITNEPNAKPGEKVDVVTYFCFLKIENSGVVISGDRLCLGNRTIAKLCGFDYSHMPNHMNMVFYAPELMSGEDFGLQLDEMLIFKRD